MNMQSKENYLWWLAWRQTAKRRGSGISFMTTMSIFGITVGVAALVIVLYVMGGFERNLRKRMLKGLPHLEVRSQKRVLGFSQLSTPKEIFNHTKIKTLAIEPFTTADVILRSKKKFSFN